MKLLKLILARSRKVAITAVLASILSGLLSAAIIFYAKRAVDEPGVSGGWIIPGFFLLGAVAVLSRILSEGMLMGLLQESLYQLRRHLVESVLHTPLTEVEKIGSARITATLTSDVNMVSVAIVGLPLFLLNLTITISCGIYLLSVSPLVAVIGFLLVPVGIFAHKAIAGGTLARFRRSREKEDDLFERFGELTHGIKDLKLSADRRGQFLDESLEEAAQEYKKYKIMGLYYFMTTISVMKYQFYAYLGLVLFVLPAYGLIPLEAIVPSTFVILYGIGPFSSMLHWFPNWSQARVALDKIEDLGLALQAREVESDHPVVRPDEVRRFSLRGVTYQHPGELPDSEGFGMGPIDLDLDGGSIIYIVGGNGSGKTTLAKIITGLYEPHAGEVLVDGRVITAQERREWFACVFVELALFAELPPGADETQARTHLKDMGLGHVVDVRDGRFTNTKRLSQGQRKRLAMVAALLHDRPIYLFDEWAADQDPAFREHFYKTILPDLKARGKLVLAISHDDRWFHLADRLVTLDYGRLRPEPEAIATGGVR